jgi:hypothetical protein
MRKPMRQGDVLLRPLTIPSTAKAVKKNKDWVVLAYGEETGHAHAIYEPDKIVILEVRSKQAISKFMRVLSDTVLKHEEHRPLPLKAGEEYEIIRQRQYDWFEERAIQIAD